MNTFSFFEKRSIDTFMDNKFPLHVIDERIAQANFGVFPSIEDQASSAKSQHLEKSLRCINAG